MYTYRYSEGALTAERTVLYDGNAGWNGVDLVKVYMSAEDFGSEIVYVLGYDCLESCRQLAMVAKTFTSMTLYIPGIMHEGWNHVTTGQFL